MSLPARFLTAAAAGVLLALPAAAQSSFGSFEVETADGVGFAAAPAATPDDGAGGEDPATPGTSGEPVVAPSSGLSGRGQTGFGSTAVDGRGSPDAPSPGTGGTPTTAPTPGTGSGTATPGAGEDVIFGSRPGFGSSAAGSVGTTPAAGTTGVGGATAATGDPSGGTETGTPSALTGSNYFDATGAGFGVMGR